jgi:hypothetical protein
MYYPKGLVTGRDKAMAILPAIRPAPPHFASGFC